MLAFLNHFPLFAVMLKFKDPDRLPGGLRFDVKTESHTGDAILQMKVSRAVGTNVLQCVCSKIDLAGQNNPIPLSAIFYQYWALWKSFSQHYSPVYIFGKLLSGGFSWH